MLVSSKGATTKEQRTTAAVVTTRPHREDAEEPERPIKRYFHDVSGSLCVISFRKSILLIPNLSCSVPNNPEK